MSTLLPVSLLLPAAPSGFPCPPPLPAEEPNGHLRLCLPAHPSLRFGGTALSRPPASVTVTPHTHSWWQPYSQAWACREGRRGEAEGGGCSRLSLGGCRAGARLANRLLPGEGGQCPGRMSREQQSPCRELREEAPSVACVRVSVAGWQPGHLTPGHSFRPEAAGPVESMGVWVPLTATPSSQASGREAVRGLEGSVASSTETFPSGVSRGRSSVSLEAALLAVCRAQEAGAGGP